MKLNPKLFGIIAVASAAIVAGGFALDAERGKTAGSAAPLPNAKPAPPASRTAAFPTLTTAQAPAAAPHPPAPVHEALTVPRPALPLAHPPLAIAPKGADARSGTVTVDPARAFAHFRVGNNSVIALYADEPVMWLGTSGGMVRYDPVGGEFKTYDKRDGLRANGILYVGKLQGKIAIGTYGGGLSLLDPSVPKWEHYGPAEGLGDAFVYDVLEASNGDVWIATGAGVSQVRGGALNDRARWELHSVASTGGGLPNNRVYRIAEGKNRSIWLATRGGLANFRNGKWKHWTHADGMGAPITQAATAQAELNTNHVAALEVDKDGMVWAGTRGVGLVRFDGARWTNYTVTEGLPSNQISALNFDRLGRLWIGTVNGLALFKDGKFQVMTTAHGLLAEPVLAVTTTKSGDLWVGSYGGVAHIRRPVVN